ncbi:FMN-linked oxidoreductase superfamily protein [Abeliophyllum distichum]|uniref:FMN-linked oxidoreductase superfamily protein n=1 Tax=Abeliophyllum distichum TaxID=126358 RepID=A0ABD1RE90_9LAMI
MKFKQLSSLSTPTKIHSNPSMATQTRPLSSQLLEDNEYDDRLCYPDINAPSTEHSGQIGRPNGYLTGESRIERAWAHWKKLGQPKLIVAPMVDNSELPFRMLCRKYGAQAAYTPMLHSRIFTENEKYRVRPETWGGEIPPTRVGKGRGFLPSPVGAFPPILGWGGWVG